MRKSSAWLTRLSAIAAIVILIPVSSAAQGRVEGTITGTVHH